jgi:hypothetical protein
MTSAKVSAVLRPFRGSIVRPDIVGNPIPADQTPSNDFNLAAFAPTPAGAARIGNAGVGILQGPRHGCRKRGISEVNGYSREHAFAI